MTKIIMDQVIWVDEKDNFLGEVSRQEAHQKGLLHRTIGIIILNDKGESYDQAAKREIQEELGLKADLKFIQTIINDHPNHRQMQAFYLLRNNWPFKIQLEEVDEVKFFTLDEIKTMLPKLTPTVKIALEIMKPS